MHSWGPDSLTSVLDRTHSQSFVQVCQSNSTSFSLIKKPCCALGRGAAVWQRVFDVKGYCVAIRTGTEDDKSGFLGLVMKELWRANIVCGGSLQLKTTIIKPKHMFLKGQNYTCCAFIFLIKMHNCMAVQLKTNTVSQKYHLQDNGVQHYLSLHF